MSRKGKLPIEIKSRLVVSGGAVSERKQGVTFGGDENVSN